MKNKRIVLLFIIIVMTFTLFHVNAVTARSVEDELQPYTIWDGQNVWAIVYETMDGFQYASPGMDIVAGRFLYIQGFSIDYSASIDVLVMVYEEYEIKTDENGTEKVNYVIDDQFSDSIIVNRHQFLKTLRMPEVTDLKTVNVTINNKSFLFNYQTDWRVVQLSKTQSEWLRDIAMFSLVTSLIAVLAAMSAKVFLKRVIVVPRVDLSQLISILLLAVMGYFMLALIAFRLVDLPLMLISIYIFLFIVLFFFFASKFSYRELLTPFLFEIDSDAQNPIKLQNTVIYWWKGEYYELDPSSWLMVFLRAFGRHVRFSIDEKYWEKVYGVYQYRVTSDQVVETMGMGLVLRKWTEDKILMIAFVVLYALIAIIIAYLAVFVHVAFLLLYIVQFIIAFRMLFEIDIRETRVIPLPRTSVEYRHRVRKDQRIVGLAGRTVEKLQEENDDLKAKLSFGVAEESSAKAMTHLLTMMDYFFQERAQEELPNILEALEKVKRERKKKLRELKQMQGDESELEEGGEASKQSSGDT